MARGLTQAQQRFEDLQLLPRHPVRLERAEQRRAVVRAQLGVQGALRRLELAVQRLLGARRQLAGDLILRASEDERPESAGEDVQHLLVRGVAEGTRGA